MAVAVRLDGMTADEFLEHAATYVSQANAIRREAECKCAGMEHILQVDDSNEHPGVRVVCTLCRRDIDLTDKPDGALDRDEH